MRIDSFLSGSRAVSFSRRLRFESLERRQLLTVTVDKAKQLGITKQGSRLLRSILVETAWRLVLRTRRWASVYEKLRARCGAKKAIVAVARRVWCDTPPQAGDLRLDAAVDVTAVG